ncbi:unnamed protein product [Brassicogethes aeneus]|uniref:Hypoxia-inducible factor 1-alpha n=1 Tax=Brassicogethes aeneus TaxID=1431903 RepID=A0A9P0FE31_BRAAE|nr:unnamed protein product [Brassicogethes aeneus]
MGTEKKAPKEKRRNNEKRKEKSRDAARSRRSRETEIFTDLATALPLSQEQVSQLDKASIMRLAIAYLRVRDMVNLVPQISALDVKKSEIDDTAFLKALEGFLVVISTEGDFVYLSDNVSEYLGISQIDLMGQNVFEYSHPCDHDEIKEILSSKVQDEADAPKSFFLRLKCTLTSKGRSVNLKSASYKVIHLNGHIVRSSVKKEDSDEKNILQSCLVAVGKPIPHPSNIEDPLPRQTFITKHSLDMKFTHAEDKILEEVLGYTADDLTEKSVYEYHHAMDSDSIGSAYKCLFSKGQTETNRYRFLAKNGGYVWVVTQATLIYDKMQKPQSVVCVNYVISGVECKDEIYSASQQYSLNSTTLCEEKVLVLPIVTVEPPHDNQTATKVQPVTEFVKPVTVTSKLFSDYVPTAPFATLNPANRPATATTKIFAPRTEDMSKGFLTFSEDEPGLTMLKDEPDDLTHLAPVAGDVCIPLTDDNPFLSEMLDDFLGNNFGPLLSEEPSDPFIAYRDYHESSTPELLSPNMSKNSDSSLPSLNSPTDSLGDEDQMSTFMNLQVEDDELALKAPYIPMNLAEDLPLLMSDDLMWNSNDRDKSIPVTNSSLAQLLSSSVNKHSLTPKDGGLTSIDEILNEKNSSRWSIKNVKQNNRMDRTTSCKRSNTAEYDMSNKRVKNEPKEKMSSELLQQLMSNNHHRGRPKGKSNWLLDSGGQKAACISQPSDSVLMNLLVSGFDIRAGYICLAPTKAKR